MNGTEQLMLAAVVMLTGGIVVLIASLRRSRRALEQLVSTPPVDATTGLVAAHAAQRRFSMELLRADRLSLPLIAWVGSTRGDDEMAALAVAGQAAPDGSAALLIDGKAVMICGPSGVIDGVPPPIDGIAWQVHWCDPATDPDEAWHIVAAGHAGSSAA